MRARVLALALAQFVEHDRLTKNTRIVHFAGRGSGKGKEKGNEGERGDAREVGEGEGVE